MPATILFWLCMLLWLVGGVWPLLRRSEKPSLGDALGLLPWIAVAVLGWTQLGPPVQ